MPHPKVKISDNSGNTVDVTESNELKVKLSDSVTVTATDLSVELDHTNDSVQLWGNESAAGSGTARALLTDDGGRLQVDVIAAPSTAVTNAGTFAVQSTLQASDGVDIGDVDVASLPSDTFKATGTSFEKGVLIQGSDGSDRHNVRTNGSGHLMVDIAAASTGASVASTPFKIDSVGYNTGDVGIMAKVVCSDTLTTLTNVTNGEISSLQVDTQGALYTTHGMTGMASGDNNSISDSTAEQLDGSTSGLDVACKRVDMIADPANTGYIWVGDSGVVGNGSGGGIRLAAGDFYSIDVNNLNDIWVIATVDNENIYYNYFT